MNQYGEASAGAALFDFVTGPQLGLGSAYEEAATVALKLAKKTSRSGRSALLSQAATWLRLHRGLEVSAGLTDYQALHEELANGPSPAKRTNQNVLLGRSVGEQSIISAP